MIHENKVAAPFAEMRKSRLRKDSMRTHIGTVLLFGFMALLITLVLIVVTKQQQKQFQATQFELQKTLLTQTSQQLSDHIVQQRESVQQFVIQQQSLLRQLRRNPQDAKAYATLEKRVLAQFPNSSSFMMVSETGAPLWLDFGFKVGPVCRHEIDLFTDEVKRTKYKARNPVSIHPNLSSYHYDLMAAWPLDPATNNIFFLSFHATELATILKDQQHTGHQLMLVRKGDTSLIEVTATGSRDRLKRPIRLSNEELRRLQTFSDIEGTDWRLIDLTSSEMLSRHHRELWVKSAIWGVTLFFAGLLLMHLIKSISRRQSV